VHREFRVGDHVFLRVKSRKISSKLGSFANMSPIYCGPFEVFDRIRLVADKLAFPANAKAHDVFHVSLLKKYLHDPKYLMIGM
jgi:hypothetical protein